ncbi:phage tail tape measure protein [Streptomyces sp. NPDC001604]|uniref:phage tail tape measure protein n=1 Tax=Streptomyces sp. NPDC001604 TaxID=3364593 RepID=UPI0036D00878
MPNVVEILVTAKDLAGPTLKRVESQVAGTSSAMKAFHKTAMLAGAGFAALGAESVKMASKFDASMTLLHTQAGVSQDKIAGLKRGVLQLAGKVGQDPDSLAESLFHVESNFESMGISSKKALALTETAAKGATVGHAKLVDVTNALTAAVASGIPGVKNFDQAMGVLNATVGVGDMKMQDLANAFGSGMVATVKGFGLSITDVGAALAVFGDNNIRGSLAGNQLRMSVMALAHPVATAGDALQKLGLTQTTLATDMQHGGLKLALEDLVARMHKAGISSKEQGQIITEAFGRKAGAGLNILVGQMDRLESKYPALEKGAKGFGQSWADTQKTFAFQTKQLQASFDALMITVGEKLIPPVQSFVNLMLQNKTATVGTVAVLAGLLTATVAVSAAMKAAAAAQALWAAGGKAVAALQGVFEGVALRAMYMREAFVAAGGGVAGLKAAFAELGAVGKASLVIGGLALLAVGVSKIADLGKTAPPDIDKLTTSLDHLSSSGKFGGELAKTFGNMDGLIEKVKQLNAETERTKKAQEGVFGARIPVADDIADWVANKLTPITRGSKSLQALSGDFKSLDEAMSGLASGGHAAVAAKDFDMMSRALKGAGYSTKDITALFPKYQASLAGLKGDQEVAAQSMGLFGKQALATQAALDAESQSAQGLEQSIMALNAVHRAAFDAETGFYQAMADASKAVKENGRTLSLNSDAGRKNRDVLSQLAAKTEDYVDKLNKQHFAADKIDKVYQQGRKNFIDTAMAMGDSAAQAKKLADELLKTPEAMKLQVSVNKAAAQKDIDAFNAAVKKTPGTKSVTLSTLSKSAEQVLTQFGYKVTHLKNGSVKVSAVTGSALSQIHNVQGAVNSLHGTTIKITTVFDQIGSAPSTTADALRQQAQRFSNAHGGLVRRASGGAVQHFDGGGYIDGPGSGTSDSILATFASGAAARVSNTEYVLQSSAVRKYGVHFLDALNQGRLKLAAFARGGLTSAEKDARSALSGEFGISYFGRLAGYQRTPFEHGLAAPSDVSALVDALNKAAGEIRAATRGRTETHLLKELDGVGKSLIRHEQALIKVNTALDAAKTKLTSLKDAASQLADSVKSGIVSGGGIMTAGQNSGAFTGAGGLVQQMGVNATAARNFAAMLAALKKRGLNAQSLSEIAQAGVTGGSEIAQRLLSASPGDIKQINTFEKQLTAAAGAAGKTSADAMYSAQIRAQDKLVHSLGRQQARLERAMDHLAAVMERSLSRALGRRASGGIVGAAASGGVRGGLTWVGEYEPELLELPVGSRVHSGPDSRRMAASAGGGGGRVVQVNLVLDGKTVARALIDPLRGEIRHINGGDVQGALGRGPVR